LGVALAVVAAVVCGGAPTAAQPAPAVEPAVALTDTPAIAASAAVDQPTPDPALAGQTVAQPPTAPPREPVAQTSVTAPTEEPTPITVVQSTPPPDPGQPTAQAALALPTSEPDPASDAGAAPQTTAALASCDPNAPPPLPLPVPGSAAAQGFFRGFRDPLPPAPLYDPPGPKRVGLQAGHWLINQVPPELRGLQGGASGGGKQEWEVNLDVAERTAAILGDTGVQTDVLPSTVPPHYQANAFIAIHADGDTSGATRGFKVARPGFSSIPDVDDRLVEAINQTYGTETELPRDDAHISLRMRYYYAFNSRRYCHAVVPGVPQAIIEMAYLTNATDRQYLIGDPQRLAQALADSILAFLSTT
jgi:N-acetylmuramoyl-L-alanine amidase